MTKLFVTLGPSSLNEEMVTRMSDKVDLFRINLSHTDIPDIEPTIKKIQKWTDVPICIDSEGAQLRNGKMSFIKILYPEHVFKVHFDDIIGDYDNISFNPPGIVKHFQIGDVINVDDDGVKFKIIDVEDDHCLALVISSGVIGSNKASDVNRELPFESITNKDKEAIKIGRVHGVENFALSFANKKEDVQEMRELCGKSNIICKIESKMGVKNLNDILGETDEILIDRGDLSRQVPIQKIPMYQRNIIKEANEKNIPVSVATNLLESMTVKSSPTRAEVNDVVSTLLMGADGLVLAAETAIGQYPYESVEMIQSLIKEVEIYNGQT